MAGASAETTEPTLTGNFVLDLSALYAASFCGPIFFWIPASTEILAAAFGRQGFEPALVGLVCAAGQCTTFTLIFLFGERAAARWQWLHKRVDAVAAHRRRFLDRGKMAIIFGAAACGVPPTVPLFILAPSLQIRLVQMLVIVFTMRFLRFAGCCYLGSLRWGQASHSGSTAAMLYEAFMNQMDPIPAVAVGSPIRPLNSTLHTKAL